MAWARLVLNVSLMCVASGCVTYRSGEKLDPMVVNQIQKNVTTRGEVEALLGPPMKVDLVSVGNRLLTYWYKEIFDRGAGLLNPNPGSITRHQRLIVWVGPNNVVQDYEFTDYLTDRAVEGPTEVVRRAAVPTTPTTAPVKWYIGGSDD